MSTPPNQPTKLLHRAVLYNDVRTLQGLLQADHDVDCRLDGETPLHVACRLGHVSTVEELLRAGADVYAMTTHRQESPLFLASMEGRQQVVEMLFEQVPQLSDREQFGALIAAARYGHHRVVEFLIRRMSDAVDLDAVWGNGQSALTMASQHGHGTVIGILLEAGCSPDKPDQHGLTALTTTVLYQHSQLVPLVLAAGAGSSCINPSLHIACSNGDSATIVELLRSDQCDINWAPPENGITVLYTAAKLGFIQVVEDLIQAGADPNIQTSNFGCTPIFAAMDMPLISLYICPQKSSWSIVRALIQGGCDPSHVNMAGRRPLDVSLRRKQDDVALLLLAADCELSVEWWHNVQSDVVDSTCSIVVQGVIEEMTQPRSLKRLCRVFFRTWLNRTFPYAKTIGCLPLPSSVKSYLLYGDI